MYKTNSQLNLYTVNKNLTKINLEYHIDYWEEARIARRHYFLNLMDMDLSQINNWLINNSKYLYDSTDLGGLKNLYIEMCDTLLYVRHIFNYKRIGQIIGFLITDGRFYIKPYAFPRTIREIHESYIYLSGQWDKIVLKRFSFPYKTILSVRYEIQSFLMYLSLEGSAQRIVSPKTNFSLLGIMKSCLDCLELPMSLYFDSFHLRKLLYKISRKASPAFSLQCVHPVITQLQYIFQMYYKGIQSAWLAIDELSYIPLTMIGLSYLVHNFLVDNYNNMGFWKDANFKSEIERTIMPMIVSLVDLSMPIDLIDKLFVQGFYDIIEVDCNNNLVRCQFDSVGKDIKEWEHLIQKWNEGIVFEELTISRNKNDFLQILMTLLYETGVEKWETSYLAMSLIHSFISDRVHDFEHAEIILKYFCMKSWIGGPTLPTQIQEWFQCILDQGIDLGQEESLGEVE